ncbi:MAG: tyrosine-type recombinase/integrase [Acidimicrobiales bacterium]|nr:tyrosine-type recombinase/integrase [Acidimicrobiales bacterium]
MASIERRSSGFRVKYRDPSGRQRSKTFQRKADANRFAVEVTTDIGRGLWLDPSGAQQSVAEWAETFLSLCRRLEYNSRVTYERDLRRYVLPRFGAYRIGSLPAEEIENWLNDELDSGIAPSSVHRHYRTLRRMLQVAIEKEKIVSNPCDRVTPPRVPKKEMVFLDWDQVIELATAHHDRYQPLILFAVETGMRWSELIGLRRGRLDIEAGRVQVTEQLIRAKAGEWIRKGPKTDAGIRSISLSPALASTMEEQLRLYSGPGPDGLVFTSSQGTPLIASSFRTNHFKPAQEAAGVQCRFHDLRHTSVALAIAGGAHPKAIQTRMGHSSITVTLDRYGHLFPELDQAIAESFGQELLAARDRQERRVVSGDFG